AVETISSAPLSGTATASSKGFEGPVAVEITAEDGKLVALIIGDDKFAETQGIGTQVLEDEFAAQFIGKTLPLAESDIDLITGATISSRAAFEAVNKAYDKLAQ
ncbi:FMN-binding protein, partial [Eubacteriales bacterium OttesenSCG-928-A19]|nr:FMN-binding protein [Eubacteriales bacterium OttesenSCG-928-A19]